MHQTYWFITVMEKLEESDLGFPLIGSNRCWGFYKDKNSAIKALHNNTTDMWETVYNYAVIEEYYEGISAYNFNRQFFKYDKEKKGYFEIDEPECVKYSIGFAIG